MSDVAMTDGSSVVSDIGHLAPMMIVALWSLLHLLADAFAGPGMRSFQRRLAVVGVLFAVAAGLTQFGNWEYDAGITVFSGFLVVDQFSILLDLGILMVCGGVILFAGDYARSHRFEYGEQEALILIAAFGMMVLAHSADLLAIFLGIETMSIAVYVLVGARWNSKRSPEAALKYFVMGAFASGMLVMGIALLYGATGTTNLHELGVAISRVFTQWGAAQPYVELVLQPEGVPGDVLTAARDKSVTGMAPAALFIPGVLLTLCALLFKVSAVPFHMWTPDAYDGAPDANHGVHGRRCEDRRFRGGAQGDGRRLLRQPPGHRAVRVDDGGRRDRAADDDRSATSPPSGRATSSDCLRTARSRTWGTCSSASSRRPASTGTRGREGPSRPWISSSGRARRATWPSRRSSSTC